MNQKMTYIGKRTPGQIPEGAHAEFSHTETRRGKEYDMYDCWVSGYDEVPKIFDENEEPKPEKISFWSRYFGVPCKKVS